ncbi:MAG: alpha/beta hydrolase [Acidimicrobiia bacterium]
MTSSRLRPPGRGVVKRYVGVNGGQIHLLEAGGDSKRPLPLVLLHQTASSSIGYLELMTELGDEFRVIALDTPGFGSSDPLDGEVTVPALGNVLVDALGAMGVDGFGLYGHHTGAAIAAWIAAAFPNRVDRLMLSGPPFLDQAVRERIEGGIRDDVIAENGQHLVDAWRRHRHLARDVPLEVAQRELVLYFTAVDPQLAYKAVLELDFADVLGAIRCPTYVMGGENDTIRSGLEPTHEHLETSVLEVVPRAGIYLADQIPGVVADRIRAWFR